MDMLGQRTWGQYLLSCLGSISTDNAMRYDDGRCAFMRPPLRAVPTAHLAEGLTTLFKHSSHKRMVHRTSNPVGAALT